MKIAVMGAGALGSLVGGLLAQNNDVTLIGSEDHMGAIQNHGLKIEGLSELAVSPKTATTTQDCEIPDLIILTVKSYDTATAIKQAGLLIGEHTDVLSLQNGLGNVQAIGCHIPKPQIIAGVTSHGATFVENGIIRHAGLGDTIIGRPFAENDAKVWELAIQLSDAGIETTASIEIMSEIWAKTLVNAAINPLTAIIQAKNGFLLHNEKMLATMKDIVSEGVRIANAHGIALEEGQMYEKTLEVARRTADNKSSMLQDIEKGRKTEIESINGALVRLGKEKGQLAPKNQSMVTLVKALEEHSRS